MPFKPTYHNRNMYSIKEVLYIWMIIICPSPKMCALQAVLPVDEGTQGPLCAWLTAGLPFCSALRLATLVLHIFPYVFPPLPHTSCSILHRQTPLKSRHFPAASSLHSRPSPQGRSLFRPQGSPSWGEHTMQQLHLSGTYAPAGQLGLGHELTSQRDAHLSGRTAPVKSCVKRNAAASKSNCIVIDLTQSYMVDIFGLFNISFLMIFCVWTRWLLPQIDWARVLSSLEVLLRTLVIRACLHILTTW